MKLESFTSNKPSASSIGNQKIEEYVNRIKGGESKDSIFQGIPESWKSEINQKLIETVRENPKYGLDEIPNQYKGLDSESLDFIWTSPQYIDEEKNKAFKEKKEQVLSALREKEAAETVKAERYEADQKKITELREQLGITKPLEKTKTQENNLLQKRVVGYDDEEHRKAVGIYNTMVDIAAGMSEGLKEDFKQKVQKYVDEIHSGKDREFVLQGLPDAWKQVIEEELRKTEQENLESIESKKNLPPINYIEVVIDDDYMQKNLMPNGALRMKGGHANWDGEVDVMQYVVSDTLSPEYREIVLDKIEKNKATQEKTYQHEAHHIKNRENDLTPHVAAENLREFLSFRVLDELSAFTTGELYNQEVTAENILQALKMSEQKITDSYYGQPFSDEARWYVSQNQNNPEALSQEINTEKYHQIMKQYFQINEQDTLAILQKAGKLEEFTRIVNGLIGKLDSLINTQNKEESASFPEIEIEPVTPEQLREEGIPQIPQDEPILETPQVVETMQEQETEQIPESTETSYTPDQLRNTLDQEIANVNFSRTLDFILEGMRNRYHSTNDSIFSPHYQDGIAEFIPELKKAETVTDVADVISRLGDIIGEMVRNVEYGAFSGVDNRGQEKNELIGLAQDFDALKYRLNNDFEYMLFEITGKQDKDPEFVAIKNTLYSLNKTISQLVDILYDKADKLQF